MPSATRDVIAPILTSTYGKGAMVDALIDHMAEMLDKREGEWDAGSRERWLMLTCWDWFPGGSTAESAAEKIEAALP